MRHRIDRGRLSTTSSLLHPLPSSTQTLAAMDQWTKLQAGLAGLNLGQSANKLAKGFNTTVQATKERIGQVAADDITELPQGDHLATDTLYLLT